MGGPIVRSGPSKEFSDNWDQVFAKKKKTTTPKKMTAKAKKTKKKKS